MPTYLTCDRTKNLKFSIPGGADRGWKTAADSNTALGAIAEDLPSVDSGISANFNSADLSMPSPWARFISFETLLFDLKGSTYGSAHDQALADWRCLITIIALHDIIGLNINLHDNQWSNVINLAMDGDSHTKKFLSIVRQVYPQNSIFSTNNTPVEWDSFVPILVKQDQAIGYLSCSTLVCSPYRYSEKANIELTNYPFYKNSHFIDPVKWINSDGNYASTMKQYLDILYQNVITLFGNPNVNEEICNDLLSLIDDFRNDILIEVAPTIAITVTNAAAALSSPAQILASVKIVVPPPQSDVQLMPLIKKNDSNGKVLYIVSDSMFGIDANRPESNSINVIGNQKLSHLSPGFVSGSNMYGTYMLATGETIYRDTDLLLNKLYLISSNDGTIMDSTIFNEGKDNAGFLSVGSKDVLWPVNSVLFDFMTAEEIRKNISITFDNVETYTVSLTLTLKKNTHTIRKSYNGTNVILKSENDMPYISICPYMKVYAPGTKTNIWKSYYVYKAETAVETKGIITEVCCDERVKPQQTDLDLLKFANTNNTYSEYDKIPTHINVIEMEFSNSTYCGTILLSPPEEKNIGMTTEWTVGVDFGTTSSAIFYKQNGAGENFVKFGTHYYNEYNATVGGINKIVDAPANSGLFEAVKPTLKKDMGKNYFMPLEYLKRESYPTIYELLSANAPLGTDTTFTYGHIPFDYGEDATRVDRLGESNKQRDLKWSNSPIVSECAKKYLHQLFLQTIFIAVMNSVGKIVWKFSYPTALPGDLVDGFIKNTSNIVEMLGKSTGITLELSDNAYYPESIVSAEYFQTTHQEPMVACVDIGGGTTDISIWKHGIHTENLLQTSIKLASRDIFLTSFATLLKNDAVFRDTVLALRRPLRDELQAKGYTMSAEDLPKIESLLFEFEEAVQRFASNTIDMKNKKKFVKTVSIGFFALLYYTMDAVSMIRDRLDNNTLSVCVGGNGAKLLDWLPRRYIANAESILALYLKEEYQMDIPVQILYNRDTLKKEAAKGLLIVSADANSFDENLMLPASEELILTKHNGTQEVLPPQTDIMRRPDVCDYFDTKGKSEATITIEEAVVQGVKTIQVSPELTSMKRFVKYLNKLNASFTDKEYLLNYTEKDYAELRGKMEFELTEATRNGRIDPTFVFGVKSMLRRENK